MNLNQNPTISQLSALHSACNDAAAHHVLWVDNTGEVRVTPLPEDINPSGFEDRFPTTVLRYETAQAGNGYVGPEAAADVKLMGRLFNSLQKEWAAQGGSTYRRYIDLY
jgi:hypothetical protein